MIICDYFIKDTSISTLLIEKLSLYYTFEAILAQTYTRGTQTFWLLTWNTMFTHDTQLQCTTLHNHWYHHIKLTIATKYGYNFPSPASTDSVSVGIHAFEHTSIIQTSYELPKIYNYKIHFTTTIARCISFHSNFCIAK